MNEKNKKIPNEEFLEIDTAALVDIHVFPICVEAFFGEIEWVLFCNN